MRKWAQDRAWDHLLESLVLGFAVCFLTGCQREVLPVLGVVPPFVLTERSGTTVTQAELQGHIWVGDFIYTRCPDICPMLTARMGELRGRIEPAGDPIRFVSFTVDPEGDTPQALRDYARRVGAPPDWWFLTGNRVAIATLLRDGFHVAFPEAAEGTGLITHGDNFVLVDRRLRIRGYYHGSDEADLARLVRDVLQLRAESAS